MQFAVSVIISLCAIVLTCQASSETDKPTETKPITEVWTLPDKNKWMVSMSDNIE